MQTPRVIVVLVHGRGGSGEDMLSLTRVLPGDDAGVQYLAPSAPERSWYPQSFMAPIEANEPRLSASLDQLDEATWSGIDRVDGDPRRVVLLGFSQGACLALEYAARRAEPLGGVCAFTGGLIGPALRQYAGDLDQMPVFLGANDPDPHVPFARVEESAAAFRALNADVEIRRYPDEPHSINNDEIETAREMINVASLT